jgi:hypothetical protein
MMPGVAPEEDRLALPCNLHLPGFRIGAAERAFQHIENFIRAEDRAELLRVAERGTRREAEKQLVDLLAGDIDPVIDLPCLVVPPQMPRHTGIGNVRRNVECRSRRWRILGHGP